MAADSEEIIGALWRPDREGVAPSLFAILDGARDRRIFAEIAGFAGSHGCLFRGELDPDLAEAAPYLVKLERDAAMTRRLIAHGWGRSWGIFVQSSAPLDRLRRHFRTFLMVYDEAGKPLYFRYYDPRVLRVYLPTCTASELATVFGTVVDGYLVESDGGTALLRYSVAGGKLAIGRTDLASAVAGTTAA